MTQNERWLARYNEVTDFIKTNHRNPSRHRLEDHVMLNWLKATIKKLNAGALKTERVESFQKLLELQIRGRFFDPFLIKGLKYPVRNKSH